jgi:Cd2+/Zn2+-exporting ATPase
MPEKTVAIAIPLLLPALEDSQDVCLDRLQSLLQSHRGILQTHLESAPAPAELCIHYDPNQVALSAVYRLAQSAGYALANGHLHATIPFTGLDSADSADVLAAALEQLPGMLHASVNYAAGLIFVAYDPAQLTPAAIAARIRQMGAAPAPRAVPARTAPLAAPLPVPAVVPAAPARPIPWPLVMVALSGLFLLLGWSGARFFNLAPQAALVLYLLAYLTGGYDLLRHAVPSVLRGHFDTDVLMLAAALGAAFLGQFAEGALLLFLFSLGHAGEHYALDRARHAVSALGQLMPQTAVVRRGAELVEEPVAGLQLDDVVVVRPGDRIPVDGVVRLGASSVDQAAITGESVPLPKSLGDEVFAGTINQEAALEVTVTHLAQDTTLARVMQLVAEAQSQQSPTQQFTQRFTARFVPAVLILTLLVAAVPPLFGWLPFQVSFYRAMLLLVAASPCALAIGTPAAVLAGIAQAARHGVLIKGGVHLEDLGGLEVIAFDKTGTLTQGRFELRDLLPRPGVSADELLALAAAVEQQSSHPLAEAIERAAAARALTLPPVASLENLPGRGVRSALDGQEILLGAPRLFQSPPAPALPAEVAADLARLEGEGKTAIAISRGDAIIGLLALADAPRPQTRRILDRLRALDITHLVMLTGDNRPVAAAIAAQVGLTEFEADLLPQDKLAAIQRLQAQYGAVAMIGDGVNDAPALATATVGIAMGGIGAAIALETADVALMADDLGMLPFAVGLSHASRAVIRQNLAISLGVIALLIAAALGGWVPLGLAVFFHEGSTVAVVLNALRLLGYKD